MTKVGSEQALAPVREPDTFAEGAWDNIRVLADFGSGYVNN